MKNKQTETKWRSGIDLTRHLISGVMCLAVISLICARASAQNLFAVDDEYGITNGTGTIDEFTPNGVRSTFASGLNIPFGLAFDKSGNLFVAVDDAGSGAVYKFTPAGARTTFASGATGPLAFDSVGNLFVADGVAIYKFTRTGARTTFATLQLNANGLAFDSAGNLFVADRGNGYDIIVGAAVYKFTPSGLRSTVASENGQVSVMPAGLAIDSTDNLFVSDGVSGSILKFTPSGVRTTFASRFVIAMAFQPKAAPTDFNNDGKPDYLLYNGSTGQTVHSGT